MASSAFSWSALFIHSGTLGFVCFGGVDIQIFRLPAISLAPFCINTLYSTFMLGGYMEISVYLPAKSRRVLESQMSY